MIMLDRVALLSTCKCRLQDWRPAILVEVFSDFPQLLQENVE
jgi:hypothetical protein